MRLTTISSILIAVFAAASAHAFIAQRTAWWQVRINELAERKKELGAEQTRPQERGIISLIDREMARGGDTLELLKKNLSTEPQSLSKEEIRTYVRQALLPVFSLRCLELIHEGAGNARISAEVREAFAAKASARIHQIAPQLTDPATSDIPSLALRPSEASALVLETVIGSVIARFDEAYRVTTENIEKHLMSPSSGLNGGGDITALRELINQKCIEECSTLSFTANPEMEEAMERSWTWRSRVISLDREVKRIEETRMYLQDAPALQSKAEYFSRNILSLDHLYFDRRAARALAEIGGARQEKAAASGGFRLPEPSRIISAMDTRRRKLLAAVTGKEDGLFFENAAAALTETAERLLRPAEKRVRACKEGVCPKNPSLDAAKKGLADRRRLASAYAEASVSFVKWASLSRAVDGGALAADYRYRADRNIAYFNFTRSLAEKSAAIASVKSPDHHRKYSVFVKNIPGIFAPLRPSMEADRSLYPHLTPGQITGLKKARAEVFEALNQAGRDSLSAHDSFIAKVGELSRRRVEKNDRREAGIAQFDMDQMTAILHDYAALYGTLVYSEKALRNYHDLYKRLEEADGGTAAQEREEAIQAGTLLPRLEDFDVKRIESERASREYLRKEIRAQLSRIRSLENFYRQNGIPTGPAMSQHESGKMLSLLDSTPSVTVGGWTMTDSNVAEVDSKAVMKLAAASMKRDWRPKKAGGREAAGIPVECEGIALKFSLPGGWVEEKTGPYHTGRGVVKMFRSRDSSASIEVVKWGHADQGPLNELSSAWHEKIGSRVMKGKWGRQGELDYYWTIARDSASLVRESYAIIDGTNTVIISGLAPRDRYGFFHRKMEKLRDSLIK